MTLRYEQGEEVFTPASPVVVTELGQVMHGLIYPDDVDLGYDGPDPRPGARAGRPE